MMHRATITLPASLVTAALVAAPSQADWTMFRGDAGRTGYVQASLNPGNFSHAWSVPLNFPQSGTGSWHEHGVSSDGTRAFITVLEGYAPSGNYHVMAFNLNDGSEAWRRTLPSSAFEGVSSPSYMNGTVYVNRAGHSSSSGTTPANYPKLFGIDSATGNIEFEAPYSAQWGENFRPIPAGNQVLAAGGYFGGFYAYGSSTGAQQWFNPNAPWDPTNADVAVDDQYVYIQRTRYNRSNGAAAGNFAAPPGGFAANPVVAGDGQLYFATAGPSGYGFAAYDRTTLQATWQLPTAGFVRNAAVSDGTLAVLTENTLTLVDRPTGTAVHSWTTPSDVSSTLWPELILTDSHAFVTNGSPVFAIDLITGQTAWTAPGGGELALTDHHLLISARSGLTAYYVPEPATATVSLVTAGAAILGRRRSSCSPGQAKRRHC